MTTDDCLKQHLTVMGSNVAAENVRLRAALRGMVDNFKPFTLKPMGAPGSAARLDQYSKQAAYTAAVAALGARDET